MLVFVFLLYFVTVFVYFSVVLYFLVFVFRSGHVPEPDMEFATNKELQKA